MNGGAALLQVQRAVASRSGKRRREWLVAAGAGGAACAWVASGGGELGAVRWLWAATALFAVAMLRVPFVLFWRADAGLLSRLPMRGTPLFDAALAASADLAAQALAASLVAAAPLAFLGGFGGELAGQLPSGQLSIPLGLEPFLRPAALAAAMAVAVAVFIPAVAVGAGSLVVSGKAQQLMSSMGPEVPAPPTAWLGVLPGLASALIVLVAIDLQSWLVGGSPEVGEAAPLLLGVVAVSLGAGALARRAAERVMPLILRDVSALDRQRLAPVELTPPPATLALARRWLSPGSARLLDKHALLVSRRYPMAAVTGAAVFATLAIAAIAAPDAAGVSMVTLALALVYAWILAGRLTTQPVELPRLLASLPFDPGQIAAARRAYVLWWWCLYALIPAVLVLARTPLSAVLGGCFTGATAALLWGLRRS